MTNTAARIPLAQPSLRQLYLGAGLLVLGLIGINAAVVWYHYQTERIQVQHELRQLGTALAGYAERSLQSVDQALAGIEQYMGAAGVTDGPSLRRIMANHDAHQFIAAKESGLRQLDAISLVDAQGDLVTSSRFWPTPIVNVADREYFRQLRDDPSLRFLVTAPVISRGSNAWTIFLARRLDGHDGKFNGVLLGAIVVSYFEDYFKSIVGDEGMRIVLDRRDGMRLAQYPAGAVSVSSLADAELPPTPEESSGRQRFVASDSKFSDRQPLAAYPITLQVSVPEQQAMAVWRDMRGAVMLGVVASALSIMLAAHMVARQWRLREELAHARAEAERARLEAEAEQARQQERATAFEAMKAAKEEAEAASRGKSEFLAMISHELRTPLNAIIGFSDLMTQETMGPMGNASYRDYARDINASGTHLLGIINDILDLSKAESGMLMLRRERIDLDGVLADVVRIAKERADVGQVALVSRCDAPGTPLHVDERKLRQMLINLLSNAIKFTPAGGTVELSVAATATAATFTVRDSGVGISQADIARVLKPFVQVDSSLSRKHEGTGLGLTLVKAMAELHGGSLTLESALAQGTTARIVLPLNVAALEPAEPRPLLSPTVRDTAA